MRHRKYTIAMNGGDCLTDDFFEDVYVVDAYSDFVNGAYDEQGEQVICDVCGSDMRWDPECRSWKCTECWNEKNRVQWFSYLCANPPGPKCISQCMENYPFCKRICRWYKIPKDDPML